MTVLFMSTFFGKISSFMKHYRELDWPSLSEYQHKQLIEFYNENSNLPIPQLKDRSNDAILLDPKTAEPFLKKVKFLNQLFPYRKTLHGDGYHYFFEVMNMVGIETGILEPHTDISRYVGFYYVIEGEADTVWFKHKTKPTESGKSYLEEWRTGELEELDRVTFKKHRWYMMDFGSIHAVENPKAGRRITLGINAGGPTKTKTWEEFTSEEFKPNIDLMYYHLFGVTHGVPWNPELSTNEIISKWDRPLPQWLSGY